MACAFQATSGIFAPLIGLRDNDEDTDTMIITNNSALTDAACELLGKERRREKLWITKGALDIFH